MSYPSLVTNKLKVIQTSSTKRNFGLTEEEFLQFAAKTKNGDESLFLHISKNHFDQCISYLKMKFKLGEDDAYDICLDTMLKFRTKILKDKIKYGNLSYLYTRMASNVFLDRIRQSNKVEQAIDFFSSDDGSYKINEDQFLDILEQSMDKLDAENKELLDNIYFEERDIHEIGVDMNISYAALRKRKQRMLEKLKSIFTDQLKKI